MLSIWLLAFYVGRDKTYNDTRTEFFSLAFLGMCMQSQGLGSPHVW